MKRVTTALLVVGLTACLAAVTAYSSRAATPSGSVRQAATLVYGVVCAAGTLGGSLDPLKPGCGRQPINSLVLDNLMTVGPDGKLKPGLALSVKHPKPTLYVYQLRKGIKFSDGTEVTSADVVATIKNALPIPTRAATLFPNVESATAAGRYTVNINLKTRDISVPLNMAIIGSGATIFSAAAQEKAGANFGTADGLPIGSGPYKIDSYNALTGAELSAVPKYWGGTPPAKRISVKFFSSETSLALAFRAGQVDIAFPSDAPAFAATAGTKVTATTGCQPFFFRLPVNAAAAPTNDVHIRRAIAAAIDRNEIVKVIGPTATPSPTVITPSALRSLAPKAQVDAFLKSLPNSTFNLARARQEMALSQYPQGTTITLYGYPFVAFNGQVLQVIANQLAKINIKVEIPNVTSAQIQANQASPKYPSITANNCQYPDPAGKLRSTGAYSYSGTHPQLSATGYVNASADKFIDHAASITDTRKRFESLKKVLRTYAADLPLLGVVSLGHSLAISNKFTYPTFNAYAGSTGAGPFIMGVKAK
jgi:peptide/nickel transport system substrate-binding protein